MADIYGSIIERYKHVEEVNRKRKACVVKIICQKKGRANALSLSYLLSIVLDSCILLLLNCFDKF